MYIYIHMRVGIVVPRCRFLLICFPFPAVEEAACSLASKLSNVRGVFKSPACALGAGMLQGHRV